MIDTPRALPGPQDRGAGPRVRVRAPGKINLFLAVGGLQDDGYHRLATVFQAVDLYEEVTAAPADGFSVEVLDGDAAGVPLDDTNLAVRAARLLARASGHRGGVRLGLRKGVPVAGGMGGGSADAAAALLACDALWGTRAGHAELHALAAQLGADVPFALMGGTAVGTGRGDELSPALTSGRFDWVLATSPRGLSTPEVYATLDRQRAADAVPAFAEDPALDERVLRAVRAADPHALAPSLRNDLQRPALALHPGLAGVLSRGTDAGALAGIVSGSGPTVAFLCADAESALVVRNALLSSGARAVHARGPVGGAALLD